MLNVFSYQGPENWHMTKIYGCCWRHLCSKTGCELTNEMSLEGLNLPLRFSPVNTWHNFLMLPTPFFPQAPRSTKNSRGKKRQHDCWKGWQQSRLKSGWKNNSARLLLSKHLPGTPDYCSKQIENALLCWKTLSIWVWALCHSLDKVTDHPLVLAQVWL